MQDARQALTTELFAGEPLSLAGLRLSRGFSQIQLARAIGTSQPHIAKIEAGKGGLQWDTVTRLADALGVKLDDLRPLIEAARAQHD